MFEIPTELIIKNSEFLINKTKASKAAKNATIGIMNSIKLKKLKTASWKTICKGTSLPVDFRNCSTKSPIIISEAKQRKTIIKEAKKFFAKYILIFENILS